MSSSALPTSSTEHLITLGAVGCSSSSAAAQPCQPELPQPQPATESTTVNVSVEPLVDLVVVRPMIEPVAEAQALTMVVAPIRKHRVAEVREQQGVSQRTLARRLGIELKALQYMERPESNLSLCQLRALQAALDVPLIDLLEDSCELSRPIAERAKMVKVMKTAVALREAKSNPRVERLVTMLCEQLIDVMPELAEVSGWPQFGSRRGTSALGKALAQPIDTSNIGIPE